MTELSDLVCVRCGRLGFDVVEVGYGLVHVHCPEPIEADYLTGEDRGFPQAPIDGTDPHGRYA